ncbi:MAG: hypothetical protein OXI40_14455 [Chloroflexota bacterium]|nr:hypothetical protein [Chloroflexota bacterium]
MESAAVHVTVETLTRIIFPTSYALAGLIVYRWFMPQLSRVARRLAGLMLAAQALIIFNALYIESPSSFYVWLWDLHREWNVAAALASTQLALVGGVALGCAWLSRSRMALQRLYFVGIALVFLFLAFDEFFTLHEYPISWNYYIYLGALVVGATLVVAARSPRRSRQWHACLLAGLAISALGAIHVERFGSFCGDYGLLYIDACPPNTVWELEEILEFLGIWLALVALLGHFSSLSPASGRLGRILYFMPALWIVLIVPSAPIWSIARQVGGEPAAVAFASGTGLHAYHIDKRQSNFTVRLFLSPERWDYNGLGYSIHLVDQITGESIVSRDTHAYRRLEFYLAPGHIPVYRQWKRIRFPPGTPTNQALSVVLTLWHKQGEEIVYDRPLSSDLKLLGDAQILLGELVLPAHSPAPTTPPLARFDKGFSLGAAELPNVARAGENLVISFNWRSDETGSEDHAQYLHLGHAESGAWFVYDQEPLGPRLPTRLWYRGLADSETWQVPLPNDLAPGQYSVFTGIYRARDGERVPARDLDGSPFIDARVPLGSLIIEAS